MRSSIEETVEVLKEAATVGERDECSGIAENVVFGQMAPMGTGAFDVALDIDMLKDVIVDHCLPVQTMMAAQVNAGMTPGHGAMTPYDRNSPMWKNDGAFKGEAAGFSPFAVNSGEEAESHGGWRCVASVADRLFSHLTICGHLLPCSRETSPFGSSPYATSPFYDRARGPTSPTSQRGVTSGVTGAVAS